MKKINTSCIEVEEIINSVSRGLWHVSIDPDTFKIKLICSDPTQFIIDLYRLNKDRAVIQGEKDIQRLDKAKKCIDELNSLPTCSNAYIGHVKDIQRHADYFTISLSEILHAMLKKAVEVKTNVTQL